MHRIHTDRFSSIIPLFDYDFPNQTALLSCVNGHMPCEVFIDKIVSPTACLVVIDFYNWTFIGGNPTQEWLDQSFSELRKDKCLSLIWAQWGTLGIHPPGGWSETIERYEFLDLPPFVSDTGTSFPLNEELKIHSMNQDLFSRCLWRNEMILAYGSAQRFLDFGLGFCLMLGEDICCEVYAVFGAIQSYELGVITPEAYRGSGYGYQACSFLVNECAKTGMQTSWSCHQENEASVRLARKLGYKIEREYQMLNYPVLDSRI